MKILWVIPVLLAQLITFGCTADAAVPPDGDFIRGIGNRIYILNFRTGRNELIYEFPVGTSVENEMYQLDSNSLLLALAERNEIVILDLHSKDVRRLGYGTNPTYLPKAKAIVYFGRDKEGNGALLVSDQNLENPRVIAPSTRYDPTTLTRISTEEVVFQTGRSSDKILELWKYNAESNGLEKLQLPTDCRLLNEWRSTTRELVCEKLTANRLDNYFFLMGLDGGKETKIDFDGYLNAGQYLPDIDALVVQKVRLDSMGAEHTDLWLYHFGDGSMNKLMNDAGFVIDAFTRWEGPIGQR